MATKTKFDITAQIPEAATRPLYAGVGVTDRVVEAVRDYVAEMQKRLDEVQKSVAGLEVQPEVVRDKATKAVTSRIDTLSKDAQARRRHVEKRVAELQSELQSELRALPTRLQKLVDAQVSTAGDTYTDLVKRGESLVDRIRRQQSTQDAEAAAKTTVSKAKTTKTQAKKATAKARKSPAKSSAKATGTSARKTASGTARAVVDAAEKVGD